MTKTALVLVALALLWPGTAPRAASPGPAAAGAEGFVGTGVCTECHVEQARAWSDSDHDWAMRPASKDTVLGDFGDVRVEHPGVVSRFFERDGRFFVTTEGPDGQLADFEIAYTFGVDPLQQYLIELPGGRLQALGLAWDTRPTEAGGQRWFSLYPEERIAPGDPLHWTGRLQNWNFRCAECHSTNLHKGYDLESDSYATTWAVVDVGCEACHGPGERHVEGARAAAAGGAWPGNDKGLVVRFDEAGAHGQVDACARCHARRHRVSPDDAHGRPFLDDFMPELLRAGLYHPDGQILDEVYVYGSFLQSRMYQAGVRCTDCHEPHSLELKAAGNAVCTRCHQETPDARFPTLRAARYDSPEHHFHPAGSTGAACVACHMPERTYMVIDPRRDHSLRVPRPDLSVKLGTPNACTACHQDQSDQWAADQVAEWYGPERRREEHYGEVLAAGRAGDPAAGPRLAALAGDRGRPDIVRATALDLAERYGPSGLLANVQGLGDPDPLVRATAVRGLEFAPPEERLQRLAPLLEDPVRAVRTEAARVLSPVPPARFAAEQRPAFERALEEYRATQLALADTPEAHLNLGVLAVNQGRFEDAEAAYRTALRIDPDFLPASLNLANLQNRLGRNDAAEQTLRQAIARHPEEGELHYSLGLLLAEEQRLADAAAALGEAARLLPSRARVQYNYGLALQGLGRRAEAERALQEAQRLEPQNPDLVYALVVFYAQQQELQKALPHAELLVQLMPSAPGPQQLLRQIKAQLGMPR